MNLEKIKPLLETKLASMGYDLYSILFNVVKGEKHLSIVVDKVEPIDMNEIVKVSEALSTYLDEIDDSNDPYMLEVSSLGAEKPLKVEALSNYIDRYVEVRMINPINGENIYEGFIRKVNEESIDLEIRIKSRIKEINIAKSNISKIRLAIKF
ncbi:MAG: ribosome maturation factor RimP [Erysipelotrichaceae bacterium]|nr:ribosome maturation factor RimP [Erysipelotrichaceae bacterium]